MHGEGYEDKDLDLKVIGKWALLLIVVLFAVVFGMRWIFDYHPEDYRYVSETIPRKQQPLDLSKKFPPPTLQPNPRVDWDTFHRQQTEILTTFDWSDRNRNLVRVPIDVAMDLWLKQAEGRP